jgi:hypothetical protein
MSTYFRHGNDALLWCISTSASAAGRGWLLSVIKNDSNSDSTNYGVGVARYDQASMAF